MTTPGTRSAVTAHRRVTGPIVLAAFRAAVAAHGAPASTLTDNGMVFTTRFSGGRGGRNGFEDRTAPAGDHPEERQARTTPRPRAKSNGSSRPSRNGSRAQHPQPATLTQLQALLDAFTAIYNHQRPHRSLPHRATPATAYTARPKADPGDRSADTHDRVRHRQDRAKPATSPCAPAAAPPHRHRPHLRRNPRPAPRPGPAHPRHQRRHRRTPPRTDPRPRQGLPAHRPPTRPRNRNDPEPNEGSGLFRCLETSHWRPEKDSNLRPTA